MKASHKTFKLQRLLLNFRSFVLLLCCRWIDSSNSFQIELIENKQHLLRKDATILFGMYVNVIVGKPLLVSSCQQTSTTTYCVLKSFILWVLFGIYSYSYCYFSINTKNNHCYFKDTPIYIYVYIYIWYIYTYISIYI